MPDDLAPVAVFAYRRPGHLDRTLAALAADPGAQATSVTVFCDGAKGPDDADAVAQARAVAGSARGFASVEVIERPRNMGLAANVIDGVTEMLQEHDRVIVLEDDMVVSRDFLGYMNSALAMYADAPEVVSIHAYMYPTQRQLPQTFFLRGADCWGWATWRSGWATFRPDGLALLRELEDRGLTDAFDFDGAFGYTQMLRDQVAGRVDSWAVRWYASAFLAGKLTLYPGRSLVENIGLDGSGTHSLGTRGLGTEVGSIGVLEHVDPVEDQEARGAVAEALRSQSTRRSRWAGRARRWWPR